MDMSFHLSAGDGEDAAVKEAFKESFRHLWAMYSSNEKALKSKLEKLGRKIDYHEKLKESLDEDVRWRMEKMDQLLTTNKRLYDEVKELRNRPPPACLNCIGLKRQVENLTSIGDNIMSLLSHNKRFTDTLQTMYTQALDSEVHMDASNDALTQALTEAFNVEPIAQSQKQSAQMVPARKSPIKVKDDGTVIIKKTTVSRVLTTTVVSPHGADSLSPGKRRSPSPGRSGKRSSLSPGRRSSLSPGRRSSLSPIKRSNLTPGKQNSPLPGNRNSQSPGKRTSLCETKTIMQSPRAITNMSSTKHCTVSPSLEISPSKNREGASATEPILTPSPSKCRGSLLTKKPPKQQLNASQSKVVESPNKLKEANDTVVAHSSDVDRFPHSSSVVKEISPQSRSDISRASSPTEQMGCSHALPRINKKNLKLHSNKRHRFTEDIPPNHKRSRISSHKEKVPKPHNETTMDLTINVVRNPMRVLVEDTCISQRARQKSSVHDKMNDTTDDNWKEEMDLVIPETVPLNFTQDEDYKDDMDEIHDRQSRDGQSRAQALIQSPPSKSSNSTNNLTNKHRKKVAVNIVANVGSTGGRHKENDLCAKSPPHDTSSSDSQDDVSSTPVSPVFKRNIAWKNGDGSSYEDNEVRSPSLFDEEVHERPMSSTLSQGNTTVVKRKGSESPGCHSNMNVKSKQLEKRNQDTSNTCLSLSMQSNPSPSVLSGKVVSKQSAEGNSGWLSTDNCASPQVQRQPQLVMLPEAVLSLRNEGMTSGQPCSAVVQCVGDICSPIRLTRARHKMLSQEVGDSAVNVSPNAKALKQTTLSQKFFQPQNYLSEMKSFKGKRLTDKEQELLDLDEAMRRSLSDMQVNQSEDDPTLNKSKNEAKSMQSENSEAMTEVDMTEPQLTSTPCTISGRLRKRRKSSDDSVDNAIFKKPSLPTTPKKNNHSKNLSQEMHRSPCLNDTVDPNEASPRKRLFNRDPVATQTNRMSNLDGNSSEVGLLPSGNGSLDPDVRLSQMDEDMSSVHTTGQTSSQVGNERFLQSVSFHELYAADGESQTQGIRAEGTMVEKKRKSSRPSASQSNIREHSEEIVGFSKSALVFGPSNEHLKAKDRRKEPGCSKADYQIAENLDDSFDILPKKKSPGFAHVEVVRKKAERKKLKTYACPECMAYYHNCDLSEEQIKERMKNCRHKARYVPPGTPEHYWDVGFPDTQECEERGYLNRTQAKPSNFRRNRGFRALFKSSKRVPVVSDFTDLFEGEDT